MGLIECKALDLLALISKEDVKSLVVKDEYFDEVPTLIQRDKEKGAEVKFAFKLKIEGEWFLGDFINDNPNLNEVSLVFSKFTE